MLHGRDIDQTAIKKTIDNLLIFFERVVTQKDLSQIEKILVRNHICLDSLKHVSSRSEKFDLVIGNPPWRIQRERNDFDQKTGISNFKRKDSRTLVAAKQKWNLNGKPRSSGDSDLYLSFVGLATKLIKGKGIVGFILPDSFLTNSNSEGYRRAMLETGSVFIESFVNSKRAFDADVRKKFQTVIFHKETMGKISASFGGVAGRNIEDCTFRNPIDLNAKILEQYSNRFVIPDVRNESEENIINRVLSAKSRLEDFLEDYKELHENRTTNFLRGADIQFGRTAGTFVNNMDIVWRKITKDDNTRTLLVNLIEAKTEHDKNSVHRIGAKNPAELLKAFAFMNSTICDFLLKTQVTVNATRESVLNLPSPNLGDTRFNVIGAIYGLGYFNIKPERLESMFDVVSVRRAQKIFNGLGAERKNGVFKFVENELCNILKIDLGDYKKLQETRFRSFNRTVPDLRKAG
jgi:hypothetical protein